LIQEFKMSTFAISNAARNDAAQSYGQNLGRAFRAFLAALFAVKPASERSLARDRAAVLRIARRYEALSPNLAAELRSITCRD
jgi:hypothetical protein